MNLLIRGGRLVDPSQSLDSLQDLWVEGGIVRAILSPGEKIFKKIDRSIEAEGCVVAPGFVDLHVHFREPGQTEKEDIESGSIAAVAGGFTSVLCMPNTVPTNDTPEITKFILEKAKKVGACRVYPVGAITRGLLGKELTDFKALKAAGCIAFSDDGRPVNDPQIMREALTKAKEICSVVIEHCEELELSQVPTIHQGTASKKLGMEGISCATETVDANRALMLAVELQASLHIAHISCGASVELLRQYKKAWKGITSEVTPHHLALTESAVVEQGTNAKMYPPLRSEEDRTQLCQGLVDGIIDTIATDHAPHTRESKTKPFGEAPNGVIGLETALPVLMNLVHDKVFTVSTLIDCLSTRPAKVVGLNAGSLKVGMPADIVIFNPNVRRKLTESALRSKSMNTPFLGTEVSGKVIYTLVGGEVKFAEVV